MVGGERLSAEGLGFTYEGAEAPALADVSLAVEPGEMLFVLGPNGAGKSTLLQLLCGCLLPASGRVRHGDQELARLDPKETARRIAVVPQELDGVGDVRVWDFVLGGRYAHLSRWRGPGPRDRAAVEEALRRTASLEFAERRMGTLSGGQRQRVMVARAVAQGARSLLLDEPTASLDPHFQAETLQLLEELVQEGHGALVVTHDLAWAGRFATRIALLQDGRLQALGSPREVLTREVLEPVYGPHLWYASQRDGSVPFVVPWTLPND